MSESSNLLSGRNRFSNNENEEEYKFEIEEPDYDDNTLDLRYKGNKGKKSFCCRMTIILVVLIAVLVFVFYSPIEVGEITLTNKMPEGFVLVNKFKEHGPITTNRVLDDGKKRNIYNLVREEDDSYYYKYDKFSELDSKTDLKAEYLCDIDTPARPEGAKGYDLVCPEYYTLSIEKAFYGHHANDLDHCKKDYSKEQLEQLKNECGNDVLGRVKKQCNDRQYCSIVPKNIVYKSRCPAGINYLNVEYRCIKEKKLEKERISIVQFYDNLQSNSVAEHSASEFYQYANIHGYEYTLGNYNYIPGRIVYFMKFQALIEKISEGLKYKKYDWVVWMDSDVIIANPNLKLETFLPDENMSNVHIIVGVDYLGRKDICCGINAGVLFLRVHEWTLDILMRSMSYPYFNPKDELQFHDQTALNNALLDFNETEHYIVTPAEWFNTFHIQDNKGNFLFHIMGLSNKKGTLYKFLDESKGDEDYLKKTNEEMRKTVLEYYHKSKEEQIKLVKQI